MNIFVSLINRIITSAVLFLIASSWLVKGQTDDNTSDPALFFAIIVVVVIIAVVLVGAVVSLIIICIVYYCCTPVPVPEEQPRVRPTPRPAQQEAPIENPNLAETLPPNYEEHEQYPRGNLSNRSRGSLPRYSLLFKKKSRRASARSQVSSATRSIPDEVELTQENGGADNV